MEALRTWTARSKGNIPLLHVARCRDEGMCDHGGWFPQNEVARNSLPRTYSARHGHLGGPCGKGPGYASVFIVGGTPICPGRCEQFDNPHTVVFREAGGVQMTEVTKLARLPLAEGPRRTPSLQT